MQLNREESIEPWICPWCSVAKKDDVSSPSLFVNIYFKSLKKAGLVFPK